MIKAKVPNLCSQEIPKSQKVAAPSADREREQQKWLLVMLSSEEVAL